MSRYNGLIIPRSYSEYINKTDAATLLQALQQSGVMDAVPIQNSQHPIKSGGVYTALSGGNIAATVLNITADWITPFSCDIRRLGNFLICNLFFQVITSKTINFRTDIGALTLLPAFTVRAIGVVETTGETLKVEMRDDGVVSLANYSGEINITGYVRAESIIIPLA